MSREIKKVIYGIENPEWWTQEGDAGFHNAYSPVWSAVTGMNKFYPEGGKVAICFVINKVFNWNYDKKDMIRVGESIVKNVLKDKRFIDKLIGKWRDHARIFYKVENKLYNTNLKELSDKELFLLYNKFRKAYEIEYSLPMMTDHYSHFAQEEIGKRLKNWLKKKKLESRYNEYFVALTSTTRLSLANEEELHLLKICNMIKCNVNRKLVKKEIARHVRNFYWIMNNYGYSQFLDRKYFVKEIDKKLEGNLNFKKEIRRIGAIPDNIRKKKRYIIKKLGMDKEFRVICEILDRFIHWQDLRKKAVLIANYYIDVFLKEISRRTKIGFWDLKATVPNEIEDILLKKRIDKKLIDKRKKHAVIVNINGKEEILEGRKSLELYNKMFPEKVDEEVKELRGVGASLGKAVGKAKVITTIKDAHKMEKGDILVASMTRPEYVVLMKKAKAIVTNEGGLTCHAAIVSRELGIPCVINTKIATKVLKDGDLIEVNADKGVVRRIKNTGVN